MKKIWFLLCVALWMPACANFITPVDREVAQVEELSHDPATLGKMRKKVLVLDFNNRSRHGGEQLGKLPTELIRNQLAKMPEFTVIKQDEIEGNETFLDDVGEYDLKKIFEKARAHNIVGVITGQIRELGLHYEGEEAGLFRMRQITVNANLKVDLYDPYTERQIFTKIVSAEVIDEHTDLFSDNTLDNYDADRGKLAVVRATDKILPELPGFAAKIGWSGRIAKVDLRRYYINAGESTGLTRGQLLKVYDYGQPIYDSESHVLLGVAPGFFKGLLKIVDYFGPDASVAVLYSGGGFKEHDRVEIFSNVQNQ